MLFRQIGQRLSSYFEMPSFDSPTLPETWLVRTGLRSWPLASVVVGGGLYLLFLILAVLSGDLTKLVQADYWEWRNSLLTPVTTIYLFLIQPPLRRLLSYAIEAFRPLLPTGRRERWMTEVYRLNRRGEWLAVGLGAVGGWLIDPPWGLEERFLAMNVYKLLGGGLLYGLTGWLIYSGLVRTRRLAALHGQAQELNIFKQPAPIAPIVRWSLGVIGCLIGGIAVSALFIPPAYLINRTTIIIYGTLILAAALVFVFSKMPASLLVRVSVFRVLLLFVTVAAIGTLGFNQLEGWSLMEAFYTTIITMTTVGYGDLSPQTDNGRIFTIALSLVAIGIGGYAVTSIASFIVEGNFYRLMHGKKVYKKIDRLQNHIILCGAGRVGKQIAIEFYKTDVPFVVIEQSPVILEALLREIEIPYIQGDATQDRTLELAGIERARGLVTALSDDKDNAFVILSGRELAKKFGNPNLYTISRVNEEKHRKKLEKAGANTVVSPNAAGGRRMASMMIRPEVVTFLDEMMQAEQQTGQVLRLEEVHINKIKNPALMELIEKDQLHVIDIGQHTGLLVVAIKRNGLDEHDPYLYTPKGNTKLQNGDILIVMGTPEERSKLKQEESPSMFEVWQSKVEERWYSWTEKLRSRD